MNDQRKRARDFWIAPGVLSTGKSNAITFVPGIQVEHLTLIEGDDIHTGVTTVLPHGENIHQNKVPAGVVVGMDTGN